MIVTTIHIDEETWKKLNEIKTLGESMNDVVKRLLKTKGFIDDTNLDNREFDTVLEEFVELQDGIETIIEESRKSFSKV